MSMTKKDYEAIAGIIRVQANVARQQGQHDALGAVRVVAHEIAEHCMRNSVSFQPVRFIGACEVKP